MKEAIVKLQYNPEYLEKLGTDLENEMQGWLVDSDIQILEIEEI